MTCVVEGFKTKKALKEAAAAGRDFYISDPSLFSPHSCMASELEREVVVTNHPFRTWFAQVGRKNGKVYVK